jgi:hypothetical protein
MTYLVFDVTDVVTGLEIIVAETAASRVPSFESP